MTTNNLFRDLLDGRIPVARKRLKPGIYFLPNLKDPTAPTMRELQQGVRINIATTIDDFGAAMRQVGAAAQTAGTTIQELADAYAWTPEDQMAKALQAQQNRNTGPAATPLRVRGRNTHYKEKA